MNILSQTNQIFKLAKNINEPPGSLSYNGQYKDIQIHIEKIQYSSDFHIRESIDEIGKIISGENITWINLVGLHDIEKIKDIGNQLNIHRMDLEDIVHVSGRSKIEIREDYLFAVLKMVYLKETKIVHEHISIILKDNILITFQEQEGDVFDPIRERIEKGLGQIKIQNIDYLLYSLIDALVDQYFEIMNYISISFNSVESNAIDDNNTNMDDVYYLRKELLYLKNAVIPIKETLNSFIIKENKYFSKEVLPYYNDVEDHLKQIYDVILSYREMINSLYEIQIANVSNKMNKVMMTLTIFSAIFIPLSFLAGVFGMNFVYFPGLGNPNALYFFIATCFVITISMLGFFKLNKWF